MRDRPRLIDKPSDAYRIALLGDSLIEGAHVAPELVVNRVMERLLHERGHEQVEVLNFGIAGIGTTQQLLLYEQRVRQFDPDAVVLVFLRANDVLNNSSTLQPRIYGSRRWYAPYHEVDAAGRLRLEPVEPRPFDAVRGWVEKHFLLAHYLERTWARLDPKRADWRGLPLPWGAFADPLDPEWARAWDITERALSLLRSATREDGVRFLVVVAPESFEIDPDWSNEFGPDSLPPELRPRTAWKRLSGIAERRDIELAALAPHFQAYARQHALGPPFFSFPCDSHFSELGHRVLAESILDQLDARGLLPARSHVPPWSPGHARLRH
jgi:lysophospholipase L1-like esterase